MAVFKFKGDDYDYDELIKTMRRKVADSIGSDWTDDQKAEYRRSYDKLIDAFLQDAKDGGNRFSVNDWNKLVDKNGEFTELDHDNDDGSENYYDVRGNRISLTEYNALKDKKKKNYSTFNANRRFVNLLHNSIGEMSTYKTPEADKYNPSGFMTWLTNKINPSGEAIDYNNWIVLDPLDKKTKKRGFANRLNQHALWLEDYMKTVKPETDFKDTAFTDYNDWNTRGKRLIENLRNGVLDESDKRDMNAFGMKWSDWKDYYYDGEKIVPKTDESKSETSGGGDGSGTTAEESTPAATTTTGRTFSNPQTQSLYNLYPSLFDTGVEIQYNDGLLKNGAYNSEVWNNVMALEFFGRNFRDSDGEVLFNKVRDKFWERPFGNASRYLPTYYNIIRNYGDATYAPVAYGPKLGYYILPNPQYTTLYGAQIIYNPTSHRMQIVPVLKEGGKISYAKEGTKTRGSYNDWSKDLIIKMGESKGYKSRDVDGHNKGNVHVADWTSAEWARLGSVALDLGAIGTSFIPGYGNVASAGLGVASTVANLYSDIERDGADLGDAKNLAVNLGLDALGVLPFGMGGTGKIAKISKNIIKIAPKLLLAFAANNTLPLSYASLKKGIASNFTDLTSDDWANIGYGASIILSGGAGAARKYNNYKAAREAAGNAIEVTVKNAKGKKERVILADSAAEHVLKASDKKKAIELVLKSNEKFKDYSVVTKTEGKWHLTINPKKMHTKSEVPIINDKVYATDKGNWSLMRPGAVSSNPFKRDFYSTELGDYGNLRYFSSRGGFWGGKNKVLGWKERPSIVEYGGNTSTIALIKAELEERAKNAVRNAVKNTTPVRTITDEASKNLISYTPANRPVNVPIDNLLMMHKAGVPHSKQFNDLVAKGADPVNLMTQRIYKRGGKVFKAHDGINTDDIVNDYISSLNQSLMALDSKPYIWYYLRLGNNTKLLNYNSGKDHSRATDALESARGIERDLSQYKNIPEQEYYCYHAADLNTEYTSNPNLVGQDLNTSYTYYNKAGNLGIQDFITNYNKDMQVLRDWLTKEHTYTNTKDPETETNNTLFNNLFKSRGISGNPGYIGWQEGIKGIYGPSTFNRRVDLYEKKWDLLTDAEKKNRAHKIDLGNNNFGYVYKMWNGDISILSKEDYDKLNKPTLNVNTSENTDKKPTEIGADDGGNKGDTTTPVTENKDWNPWEFLRYQANNADNRYMTDLYKAAEIPFLQRHSDLHSYVYDDLHGELGAARQGATMRALANNNPTSDWLQWTAGLIDTNSLSLAVQEAAMLASSLLGRQTLQQAWQIAGQNLQLHDNDAMVNKQAMLLSYINKLKLEAILASKNAENKSQLYSRYSLDRLKLIDKKREATYQYNLGTIKSNTQNNYATILAKDPLLLAAYEEYRKNGTDNMQGTDEKSKKLWRDYQKAEEKILQEVRNKQYNYVLNISFARRGKKLYKDGSKVKIASMRSKQKSDSDFIKRSEKSADRNEKAIARTEKSMYRMREYKRSNK